MRHPSNPPSSAVEALSARLVQRPWRVVHTAPAPGAWNMALDEALLELAAEEHVEPTLRFYAWSPPCVSLGHFQTLAGVDQDYARAQGWDLVRRPTGGRGVLHQHEITYSLILPPSMVAGAGIRTSYAVLIARLNDGLRSLLPRGLDGAPRPACEGARRQEPNCFALASECDTLAAEGKLIGSAQVRRQGALLQHGSILADVEPEAWEALFGTRGRPVSLRQLLGREPTWEQVTEALAEGFTRGGIVLHPGSLTDRELRTARRLEPTYRKLPE